MMHAYDKNYVDDAMSNLGEAFDYAVNECNLKPDEFLDMFITVGVAGQFGEGTPKYVSGMSGTELVWEVFNRAGLKRRLPEAGCDLERSPEYWCGWILAYYQWYTGKSFKQIKQYLSMEEISKMYGTLHEASEDNFVDAIDRKLQGMDNQTKLQILRKAVGYSQKELALRSGVTLRMIQQYEQRAKDINKASAVNLVALSKVLGCKVEDLLE